MWIAELKSLPGRYAVSPDEGDEGMFTTSPSLACVWLDQDQLKRWSRNHGGLWSPVKK